MLGWKVANIPLIPGIAPNKTLFEVNQGRIVGLKIDPGVLIDFRSARKSEMGIGGHHRDQYANPEKVYEEIEEFSRFIHRRGYPVIDTTRKPIEAAAGEVVRIVQRKLKLQAKTLPES